MVTMDITQRLKKKNTAAQSSGAVSESRDGRPVLPVPNSPYGLYGRNAMFEEEEEEEEDDDDDDEDEEEYSSSEVWSCVKVEVAVQGSP